MHSSNILTTSKDRGFTLIEIFVVVGIIMMIVVIPMFVDFGSFRGDAFRAEVSILGGALQKARANALNNINQSEHGVAIIESYDGYIIFEGSSYEDRDPAKDEEVRAYYAVTFSPSLPIEIVFEQLSGGANYDGEIEMIDEERDMSASIKINHEGQISW